MRPRFLHPPYGQADARGYRGRAGDHSLEVKIGAVGSVIDIPLGHKDDVWSFDQNCTLSVMVPNAHPARRDRGDRGACGWRAAASARYEIGRCAAGIGGLTCWSYHDKKACLSASPSNPNIQEIQTEPDRRVDMPYAPAMRVESPCGLLFISGATPSPLYHKIRT